MSRLLLSLLCAAALVAADAHALSPGPPRPPPEGIATYCSNTPRPLPTDPVVQACDFDNQCDFGAVCLAAPASLLPDTAVRGTLTVIVDEDVSGFGGGGDGSAAKVDNARLSLLLEFRVRDQAFAVADTLKLTRNEVAPSPIFGTVTCNVESEPAVPSLCAPGWSEPASEQNLVQGLNLQWTPANPQMNAAILSALLTPAQLADPANANAQVLLEVVDRDGTFDHQGTDPLASIARFKVTLRVRP